MKKQLLYTAICLSLFIPLYGYAEEATTSVPSPLHTQKEVTTEVVSDASSTEASSTPVTPVKSFTLCSQEAIETRDTSIATSRSLYNTAMANALKDRKNREKAAVAIVDESDKKDAIKASVDTYKTLTKSAQNTLTTSRKTAWTMFESDIKQCHDIEDEAIAAAKAKQDALDDSEKGTTELESDGASIKDTIKAGLDTLRSLFN